MCLFSNTGCFGTIFSLYLTSEQIIMKKNLLFLLVIGLLAIGAQNAIATEIEGDPIVQSSAVIKLGQNYPNPATGKTIIDVSFATSEATLIIYNVLGKVVEEIAVYDKKIILDVTNYPEGVYLYTLEADGEKVTRRMTVRK